MKLNLGSGQKHLDGYLNVDISDDHNHRIDVLADVTQHMPQFADNCAEVIIAEHVLEHVSLHQQEAALGEWYRILAPGGRLVLSVPDLRALATRWLNDPSFDFFLYAVNVYGAYNGHETDRHKWGFDWGELQERLSVLPWEVRPFQGSEPIAKDWWILAAECRK